MSEIRVPDAALDAGCRAYTAVIYRGTGTQTEFRKAIRAAFVAMVEAWEGMSQLQENDSASIHEMAALILPLMENPDDKA